MAVTLDGTFAAVKNASELAHQNLLDAMLDTKPGGAKKTAAEMQKQLLEASQESSHIKEVIRALKDAMRTV